MSAASTSSAAPAAAAAAGDGTTSSALVPARPASMSAALNSAMEEAMASAKEWTDEERKAYVDEMEEHPLFFDASTTAKERAENTYMKAIDNMEYNDDETPQGLAHEAKERGNAAFKRGEAFYGHALKYYRDCLEHAGKADAEWDVEMRPLQSVVYANMAAIHLARKKYLSAIDACEKAIRMNPTNVKAVFRAAKASMALGKSRAALQLCDAGLASDPASAEFKTLRAEAKRLVDIADRNAEAGRRVLEARRSQITAVRAAIKERGMAVGPCIYKNMRRTEAHPYVDASGVVHWPVLLLYPQHRITDWLDDVAEVASIHDILSAVLPSGDAAADAASGAHRPLWDGRGEYTVGNVDVFYLSHPCKPLADVDQAWAEWAGDKKTSTRGGTGKATASKATASKATAIASAAAAAATAATVGGAGASSITAASGADAAAVAGGDDDEPEPQVDWKMTSAMVRVPPAAPLMLAQVQRGFITADMPVLYVVARSSDVYREMKGRAGGRFPEVRVPELPPPPADA